MYVDVHNVCYFLSEVSQKISITSAFFDTIIATYIKV